MERKTALVIEDNEDNMILITRLLQNAGYGCEWAASGALGVEKAEQLLPDFIILDIQLPDIEGTEVLQRIRAQAGPVADIPIIAMTSYAMAGDREKLLKLGCDGYIEKPIDPMSVIHQLKQILGDSK
ncbi:MAG: response regulator [Planctomycetota bacterium]|nr:MAG: response regulator [Planctomycetota bacterium]